MVWYVAPENYVRMPKMVRKVGDSYGMEWSWVGAFTDFRGSGYRNPVQISGVFSNFTPNLVFLGLVYYR